jgi:effector-binding domain-containing protein
MQSQPQVQQRAAQPYLAVHAEVTTEAEFRQAADSGFPELFTWLRAHGVSPAGPPFIRYLAFDEAGGPREIELAVPVDGAVEGDERIRRGALPPGRYLTLLHVGPYNSATAPDLKAAHAALRAWARERGIPLGGCVERYLIGPVEEADHSKWETELAYLIALMADGQMAGVG